MMNIVNAWAAAEKTAFEKIVSFTASKEKVNCWRGYLPEGRNGWMLTSGTLATGPIERFWGDSPLFCTMSFGARVAAQYTERDDCLKLAGQIFKMLKETTNLNGVGNVRFLRLANMPSEPLAIEDDRNQIMWLMDIPMQLIFATELDF